MMQRGAALGEEFRGKGVNVALGPMMLVHCTFLFLYIYSSLIGTSPAHLPLGGTGRGEFFVESLELRLIVASDLVQTPI